MHGVNITLKNDIHRGLEMHLGSAQPGSLFPQANAVVTHIILPTLILYSRETLGHGGTEKSTLKAGGGRGREASAFQCHATTVKLPDLIWSNCRP